ncbi:E3 ubiquitin-protein ligase RNF144A [Oncorhynchus tshawytscha]|uniref:E3 ubiquitin-protein ligase RNF144A n=1 Tax=Oncorhynchus tshawytscha TaxID=74940 RepID=UPI000D0982C3|nr:E3 ubiquitin-protein ligase RNF144A [Oncorhynchus tshawytscha]
MSGSLLLAQSVLPTPLKCPSCHQTGARKVKGQCAVCKRCSETLRRVYQFCWACGREWHQSGGTLEGQGVHFSCPLPGCALRAALLSPEVIVDPSSSAQGCPFFRACPHCKAILTHTGEGCPNIICPHCQKEFCFRCLKKECYDYEEEDDDDDDDDDDFEYPLPCTVVDNSQSLRELEL